MGRIGAMGSVDSNPLEVSESIRAALSRGRSVVALESCVISHGLPPDVRVSTALELEEVVRQAGAEPATIGVIGGRLKVGLAQCDIERLACGDPAKLAARDLPYAVAQKLDGGTTVSASARIAVAAGIDVLSTGGIGGVHLDFNETGDISADLWELVGTPITVVCSGPKAVTDAARTAEWLETHSIPLYGWETDELPVFFSARSGIKIPKVVNQDQFAELVRLIRAQFGARCGIVLAVPIPADHELDISAELGEALRAAAEQQIAGRWRTPYLLRRIAELTNGRSVQSNVALLQNNAKVAAQIACALSKHADRRMGFVT